MQKRFYMAKHNANANQDWKSNIQDTQWPQNDNKFGFFSLWLFFIDHPESLVTGMVVSPTVTD